VTSANERKRRSSEPLGFTLYSGPSPKWDQHDKVTLCVDVKTKEKRAGEMVKYWCHWKKKIKWGLYSCASCFTARSTDSTVLFHVVCILRVFPLLAAAYRASHSASSHCLSVQPVLMSLLLPVTGSGFLSSPITAYRTGCPAGGVVRKFSVTIGS